MEIFRRHKYSPKDKGGVPFVTVPDAKSHDYPFEMTVDSKRLGEYMVTQCDMSTHQVDASSFTYTLNNWSKVRDSVVMPYSANADFLENGLVLKSRAPEPNLFINKRISEPSPSITIDCGPEAEWISAKRNELDELYRLMELGFPKDHRRTWQLRSSFLIHLTDEFKDDLPETLTQNDLQVIDRRLMDKIEHSILARTLQACNVAPEVVDIQDKRQKALAALRLSGFTTSAIFLGLLFKRTFDELSIGLPEITAAIGLAGSMGFNTSATNKYQKANEEAYDVASKINHEDPTAIYKQEKFKGIVKVSPSPHW